MLTTAQVARAIAKNDADLMAVELVPALSDLFGLRLGALFTPDLVQFVADYQASLGGLKVDGVIGKITRKVLTDQGYLDGEPTDALWPNEPANPESERAHYVHLCQKADRRLPGARPVLLGLRGVYPLGRRSHRMIHARRYDDTFILLRDGSPPDVFRGATHAYQLAAPRSPDGGVGSIRPGSYVLTLKPGDPPQFDLTNPDRTSEIPALRDTDRNGVISIREEQQSLDAVKGDQVRPGVGMFAKEILFHPGFDALRPDTGKAFSSIGCQTAPLAVLERLRDAGREIDYVLATAARLAEPTRSAVGGSIA